MHTFTQPIQKSDDSGEKRRSQIMSRLIGAAKRIQPVLIAVFLLFVFTTTAQQSTESGQNKQTFDQWDPTDESMKTGPAIGETIPNFEAKDQNGKLTHFKDIVGSNGALILFHRSADW